MQKARLPRYILAGKSTAFPSIGDGGYHFLPQKNATRAEAAAILYRLLPVMKKLLKSVLLKARLLL